MPALELCLHLESHSTLVWCQCWLTNGRPRGHRRRTIFSYQSKRPAERQRALSFPPKIQGPSSASLGLLTLLKSMYLAILIFFGVINEGRNQHRRRSDDRWQGSLRSEGTSFVSQSGETCSETGLFLTFVSMYVVFFPPQQNCLFSN